MPIELLELADRRHPRMLVDAKRPDSSPRADVIVETAAQMFNLKGVGASSLFNDIAAQLGVSRPTLYYYVGDREDLLFQCYRRTCEIDAEILAGAKRERRGLDQVLAYLSKSLAAGRQRATTLTDLALLSPAPRQAIQTAQERNLLALLEMIRTGTADGSIWPCDEAIIAQTLAGIVAYSPICSPSGDPAEQGVHAFNPDGVVDFLAYGAAADPRLEIQCPVDISEFSRLNALRFDRKSRSNVRTEQILMIASRLFNQRGGHGVSLDDIAETLGATRGALYYYIRNKKQLLQLCALRALDLYDQFLEAGAIQGRNGAEAASIVSHLHVQAQATGFCPLAPWIGVEALTPSQREKRLQRMRGFLARTIAIAQRGIDDGTRRPHDMKSAARLRPGAFFWIPQWYNQAEGHTPRKVADEVVLLFHRGLANR
jgi:AcrR family transcriptional regulator